MSGVAGRLGAQKRSKFDLTGKMGRGRGGGKEEGGIWYHSDLQGSQQGGGVLGRNGRRPYILST